MRRLASLLLLFAIPVHAQTVHTVKLTIIDTNNPAGTVKYNVYRANMACSTGVTMNLVTLAPISTLIYTDTPGPGTFFYAATAVASNGDESAKSPTAAATIAAPPNAITITVTVN